MLELHLKNISCSVTPDELAAFGPVMTQAHEKLMSCPDLSGWLTLPRDMLESPELPRSLDTARHIRENFDVLVVIGVGGSYLGARAFIDMLRPASDKKPEIFRLFAIFFYCFLLQNSLVYGKLFCWFLDFLRFFLCLDYIYFLIHLNFHVQQKYHHSQKFLF